MAQRKRNFAHTNAISFSDLGAEIMCKEDFNREKIYQCTVSTIRQWLDDGIITDDEFIDLARLFEEKYHPIIGSICLT